MSKTKKMATILKEIEKAAKSKKFVENYNGEMCFNYYRFTEYCHNQSYDTNQQYGFHLRDIVMEKLDKKYHRNGSHNFLGMPLLD